ncbi:hypothetical protein HPB49_003321 [Dermacentor silvarum]|uniref:Uncharacterized protein n=1 Tax=Dermacentor silvarum TaxID=543639 RepID=A0ACB8CUX6_DERSI|nr:hypothetical protein HPB49_003321 [Dermacentor silvarum]
MAHPFSELVKSRLWTCTLKGRLHCFETSTMPATVDAAQLSGQRQVSPPNPLPKALSSEFGSLFAPGLGLAKGSVHRIKIRLAGPPVASKLRRLPLKL